MKEVPCKVCANDIPEAAIYCTHCESYIKGWQQVLNISPIVTGMIAGVATAGIATVTILHSAICGH